MEQLLLVVQRITLLWSRFSPLETYILSSVRSVLPTSAQSIYDAQVQAITHVQRIPGSTESCFYRRKGKRFDWSGVPVFPRNDDFMLAQLRFSVRTKRYTANLYSIKGHVFDIVVTPNPKLDAFAQWDSAPIVQLVDNPMDQGQDGVAVEAIARVWREFVDKHEAGLHSWFFYNEKTAYRVGLQEGEFLVLAERNGDQFILQNLDPNGKSQELFYLASHEGVPMPIRGRLEDIILQART